MTSFLAKIQVQVMKCIQYLLDDLYQFSLLTIRYSRTVNLPIVSMPCNLFGHILATLLFSEFINRTMPSFILGVMVICLHIEIHLLQFAHAKQVNGFEDKSPIHKLLYEVLLFHLQEI